MSKYAVTVDRAVGQQPEPAGEPSVSRPSPDLMAVLEHVQLELGELIEALDGPGAEFARSYVSWMCGQGRRPNRPPALPSAAADLIRELVLDASAPMVGRSKARVTA